MRMKEENRIAPFSHISVKHRAAEFEKSLFDSGEKCQMHIKLCGSKAAMSEFN